MKCYNCGCKFDDHTCTTGEKAEIQDGDITICSNCEEVHQLVDGVLELIDIKCLPVEIQNEIERAKAILSRTKAILSMVKK